MSHVWAAEHTQLGEASTCTICGKKLIWSRSGDSPYLICPLHSTRGVPKDKQ